MKRCNECGKEIDDHQHENFNQVCPDCMREYNTLNRYDLLEELVYSRNQFEASLIILSLSCVVIGILLYLVFHPLLIILSVMGALIYILTILHNNKTRKLREKLKKLQILKNLETNSKP
jgi:uncharacterized integral membrane protein